MLINSGHRYENKLANVTQTYPLVTVAVEKRKIVQKKETNKQTNPNYDISPN